MLSEVFNYLGNTSGLLLILIAFYVIHFSKPLMQRLLSQRARIEDKGQPVVFGQRRRR